ncbi:O-antigen polymerase [Lederbergia citri]|uniref:Oligosaccharide repeat unit polymerase n=1 Tax=Lederbergia citri TaxID=2833580 RepID=A0A942TDM3_9BACI|nr:O-antigen polymerase [Lederbergia citri]MBS4195730.1 oligosaccharide repeat unit polymerase [Lederbergia citri]
MQYIALWGMVVVISFCLFKSSAGSMSLLKPNLLSIIFYYSLLISSYIGSLLIVLKIDNHYMTRLLSSDYFRLEGFIVVSIVMILLPLTMFIVKTLTGFNSEREFNTYLESPIKNEVDLDKYYFFMYSCMSLLSLMSVAYTVYHLKAIPLLSLILGGDNLSQLRIEASHGFTGNTIIRNVFGITLAPILSMITFVYANKTRKLKWIVLFFITFSCAIFMQTYDLAKGPIFFYALMFILLLIYMGILRLTWFKMALFGAIAAVGLVTMYVLISGVTDVHQYLSYNSGPIGRLILSQIGPLYLHLDLFTGREPLLMGQSLPSSLLHLYDLEQIRSARLAMEVFFPERVEAGTAGVLNTLFAAEAFANFGYLGVILGTIYIGVYVQVIYIIFTRLPKNPLFLSLFVYFTVSIPRVVIGGFADFLLNTLWVAVLVILLAPYLLILLKREYRKIRNHLGKNKNAVGN